MGFYEEIENAVREQELKKRRKVIRDLKEVAIYFGFVMLAIFLMYFLGGK